MKLLLAGTALLVLAATGSGASAEPFDFTYTGSLVTFTVPQTGSYQILAFGAQGGGTVLTNGAPSPGGLGAEIGGDFSFAAGEVLQIAVAGMGVGGGGGGGSFVVGPNDMPLVIAGGGGGSGFSAFNVIPGQGGLTGPDGGSTNFSPPTGGTNGNGGLSGFGALAGAGGGGFLSAGENGFLSTGGGAFPNLAGGRFGGGFGGGGGDGGHGGGGGGGYSGGGGGNSATSGGGAGDGGGSFDAGVDQILMADFNAGNGEVEITPISEPATMVLFGAGLLGLAAFRRRHVGRR